MEKHFDRIATLLICLISLFAGLYVYMTFPHGEDRGFVLGVIFGSFTGAGSYFYKSSSSGATKDLAAKDTTDKLVENLSKLNPSQQPNQLSQVDSAQ